MIISRLGKYLYIKPDKNNTHELELYFFSISKITFSIIDLEKININEEGVLELFKDLIGDHKEQGNLKRIESLEQKLINNMDENSYSELIKLKSQLNRE